MAQIHEAIVAIASGAKALAPEKAGGVPFAFRGIAQVIDHLSPLLNEYGVFFTSKLNHKETTAREFGAGSSSKTVTQTDITVEYTFWASDGSSVTTEVAGLAQDFADRSAAQAQSVALRVALLQIFHLPNADKEPEAAGEETQKVIAQARAEAASQTTTAPRDQEIRDEVKALLDGADNAAIKAKAEEFAKSKGKGLPAGWGSDVTFLTAFRDSLKA